VRSRRQLAEQRVAAHPSRVVGEEVFWQAFFSTKAPPTPPPSTPPGSWGAWSEHWSFSASGTLPGGGAPSP